jgi:hypothetical protein
LGARSFDVTTIIHFALKGSVLLGRAITGGLSSSLAIRLSLGPTPKGVYYHTGASVRLTALNCDLSNDQRYGGSGKICAGDSPNRGCIPEYERISISNLLGSRRFGNEKWLKRERGFLSWNNQWHRQRFGTHASPQRRTKSIKIHKTTDFGDLLI